MGELRWTISRKSVTGQRVCQLSINARRFAVQSESIQLFFGANDDPMQSVGNSVSRNELHAIARTGPLDGLLFEGSLPPPPYESQQVYTCEEPQSEPTLQVAFLSPPIGR
jgi:hypothetical protein